MDVAAYCLSKPEAEESYPFGPSVSVFKVSGTMFALVPATEKPFNISLKCDPLRAKILRQQYPEIITAGYHLNKQHWNTLELTGVLPDELITELIDHSYALVAK